MTETQRVAAVARARAEQSEWNFTPLESMSSFRQWHALKHELDREIARKHNRTRCIPWLDSHLMDEPEGPIVDIAGWDDFAAEYQGRFGELNRLPRLKFYPVAVDWAQIATDADLRRAAMQFESALRRHRDRPKGRTQPMPLLWGIARLRLQEIYGLTFKGGAAELMIEAGAITPEEGTSASWSNSTKRAKRFIEAHQKQILEEAQRRAADACREIVSQVPGAVSE